MVTISLLSAVSATAGDGFSMNLEELGLKNGSIIQSDFNRELRRALWDSPLGRLDHQWIEIQLRQGVPPGPDISVPVQFSVRLKVQEGLPLQLVLDNGWMESWHDLPLGQKAEKVGQALVAVGAVSTLIEVID
jgi:hypothetical protein